MNKKGSAVNIFLFAVVGFAMAVTLILGFYVVDTEILPKLRESDIVNTPVVNDSLNTYEASLATLDYAGFGIIIGLWLVVILAALLTRIHPAFYFIYVLMLVLAIVVSVPLSNSYQSIEATLGVGASFTITGFVLNNSPLFTAIVGMAGLVISFVKMGSGGARGL